MVHGRRNSAQVFNRHDDCCFGIDQQEPERDYDADLSSIGKSIKEALLEIGGNSSFELVIDEKALNHQISPWTREEVILKDLRSIPMLKHSQPFISSADRSGKS